MNKYGRNSFWILISLVVLATFMVLIEEPLVDPHDRWWFTALKLLLIYMNVPAAFIFRKNPYSPLGHLIFGLSVILYSAQGQWYRPFYEYTLFQGMAAFALLFYPSRKIFLSLLVFGVAIFSIVYCYRFEEVVRHANSTPQEGLGGIVVFALLNFWIFKLFSEQRAFREQALARFGLLGRHSASILHDLKSTMASPKMYAELIEEAFEKGDVKKAQGFVKELLASLQLTNSVILNLNQMNQLANFGTEPVRVREVIDEVLHVLRNKVDGIQVETAGDMTIQLNRSLISSLILNILMNSLENFRKRQIAEPAIRIAVNEGVLLFEDNGGGFNPSVLEKLKSGLPASSNNSGLGLFLLRDAIQNAGGRVEFYNSKDGACVKVHLKTELPDRTR